MYAGPFNSWMILNESLVNRFFVVYCLCTLRLYMYCIRFAKIIPFETHFCTKYFVALFSMQAVLIRFDCLQEGATGKMGALLSITMSSDIHMLFHISRYKQNYYCFMLW